MHAALNVILTYKHTDDVESTHTPASLFEGDIKLTEEQRTNNMLFGNPEGGTSRAATNVDKIKWPNGVIPYEFDCSVGEYLRGFSSFTNTDLPPTQSRSCRSMSENGFGFRKNGKFLLVEPEILRFGIRNTAQGVRNPASDWNPESKRQ